MISLQRDKVYCGSGFWGFVHVTQLLCIKRWSGNIQQAMAEQQNRKWEERVLHQPLEGAAQWPNCLPIGPASQKLPTSQECQPGMKPLTHCRLQGETYPDPHILTVIANAYYYPCTAPSTKHVLPNSVIPCMTPGRWREVSKLKS